MWKQHKAPSLPTEPDKGVMVRWQLHKQVRKSHYKKSFQGCVCAMEKCVKKSEPLTDSLKNEVKSLYWWSKPCVHWEWKQPFLPSVFLPEEWKFLVFPPGQPSVRALTHYTCVRTPTSINPFLTGNQKYPVDDGLLGVSLFSPLSTHPWQSTQLIWPVWWQSHSVSKPSGVWSPCMVRMREGTFSGGELFPKWQDLPVLPE